MRLEAGRHHQRFDPAGSLVVDFRATGNAGKYRRAGWAEPEADHTWTMGPESHLELPRPAAPDAYRMVIELGPFVCSPKLPVQQLTILVNGREVGDFFIRETTRIECAVPWEAIAAQDRVAVTFRHPAAARPRQVSGVADDREIAFAFERLGLSPLRDASRTHRVDTSGIARTDAPPTDALPLDRLMLQFESLGENCEFGLAQRRCGADPIGLLRFASAPIPALLSALRARFEGVGDWENIDVRISENQHWHLRCKIQRKYSGDHVVGYANPAREGPG